MGLALVKKLAETAWNMWEHQNKINNNNETATLSLEVNQQIEAEYTLGFRYLDPAAQQLGRKDKTQLMKQPLGFQKRWLRSIRAHQAHCKKLDDKNQVPQWVTETIGLVAWIHLG